MAKNDPRDPTWQYIVQALSRFRAFSHTQGHTLRGECCCFVSGLALGLVMQTRNGAKAWSLGDGGPTLTTDDRKCVELAYADHYLTMRASTGLLGAPGVVSNFVVSTGYDAYKKTILAMKALGNEPFPALAPNPLDPASMIPDATKPLKVARGVFCGLVAGIGEMLARKLQENPNVPLSAPTPEGAYWANQGNIDGFDDARSTPRARSCWRCGNTIHGGLRSRFLTSVRLAARAIPRALGAIRDGRGGDLPDVNGGRPSTDGLVSGATARQATDQMPSFGSVPTATPGFPGPDPYCAKCRI